MVVKLTPELEVALGEQAKRRGVPPEQLALEALQERFLAQTPVVEPQDEWERRLFTAAVDCGGSVSNSALSSEGLYD